MNEDFQTKWELFTGNGGLSMIKKFRIGVWTIVLLMALMASACEPNGQAQDGTPAVQETPTTENGDGVPVTGDEGGTQPEMDTPTPEADVEEEATPEPEMTPTPEEPEEADTETVKDADYRDYGQVPVTSGQRAPMTRSAQMLPDTARGDLMLLSTWLDFEVVDTAGNHIGSVHDYVLNTCEAHIIYVAIQANDGELVLMPYEVVTLGGGIIDYEARVIAVSIAADEIQNAPTIRDDADITDVTWEADSRTFWENYMNLSNLTTACHAPTPDGSRLVLIDYASNLLQARFQDGNGQPIGVVEEIIVFPETGLLRYFVINLEEETQQGQRYVLVPLGALNIRSQDAAGETVLVLLVERQVLMSAPVFDQVPDTTQQNWEGQSLQYWSQHVPMTRDQLP
jgi:sporulation protein YlmC with PRC-barrel domain